MKSKLNGKTIDCSDLAGTYTLEEMPMLLKRIQAKIDKVINKYGIDIKSTNISIRLKNSLRRADFDTLNELTTQTEKQILSYNGIGKTGLNELKTVMDSYNLSLKK